MSVKIMGALWERDLSHRDLLVLLALADHADHNGCNIRPGVPLVAWKCGYSPRQMMRIFQDLEARGILVRTRERTGKATEYRIDLSNVPFKKPFERRPTTDTAMSYDTAMSPLTSHESDENSTPDMPSAKTARIRQKRNRQEKEKDVSPDGDAARAKPKRKKADTPKPYAHVPHPERTAVIEAWLAPLPAKPVGNPYAWDSNHQTAADLIDAGYTAEQVAGYVTAALADPFWRGKTLTLQKVAELLPAWVAAQKPAAPKPNMGFTPEMAATAPRYMVQHIPANDFMTRDFLRFCEEQEAAGT